MITFERTREYGLVGAIRRHPKLYDAAADDFSPAVDKCVVREDEAIWYVLALREGSILGLFAIAPQNAICWEIHTRLLPASWGAIATAAAAGIIPWIWEHTPCERLVTVCPIYNRLAIRFAERAGLMRYGVNSKSWLKNGRLFDQVLLGISKAGHIPKMSPTSVGCLN